MEAIPKSRVIDNASTDSVPVGEAPPTGLGGDEFLGRVAAASALGAQIGITEALGKTSKSKRKPWHGPSGKGLLYDRDSNIGSIGDSDAYISSINESLSTIDGPLNRRGGVETNTPTGSIVNSGQVLTKNLARAFVPVEGAGKRVVGSSKYRDWVGKSENERAASVAGLKRGSKKRREAVVADAIRVFMGNQIVADVDNTRTVVNPDGSGTTHYVGWDEVSRKYRHMDRPALTKPARWTAGLEPGSHTRREKRAVHHISKASDKYHFHKTKADRRYGAVLHGNTPVLSSRSEINEFSRLSNDKQTEEYLSKNYGMNYRWWNPLSWPHSERRTLQRALNHFHHDKAMADYWAEVALKGGHRKQWYKPWTWKQHGHASHGATHTPTTHPHS